MKKNIFIFALLLIIVFFCGASLYLMNKSDEIQKINIDSGKIQEVNSSLYEAYVVSETDLYQYQTYNAEFFFC